MLVGNRMSHPVITIHPNTSVEDALNLMVNENVRRLPVVDDRGHMVGIVSERDLIRAEPSEATTLDIWEQKDFIRKLKIDRIMTRNVITVTEETTLEEAARIMADKKIAGLPVIKDDKVIGIITETDLFKIFLEILGAREPGVRLTVMVSNVPGKLYEITKMICDLGGNIVAIGTIMGDNTENRELTMKVSGISVQALKKGLVPPLIDRIIDIREPKMV